MDSHRQHPDIQPPVQARPVHRAPWSTPATADGRGGVEAAKTPCADLPGMAREMCYAAHYGIST
ncbi:hypothetical protein [Streptomyces klenkii]|uniref:hypothetical protein n=1 Tax=Streptomyces klenkii TaxID=1420899 RepID=UPI003449874E